MVDGLRRPRVGGGGTIVYLVELGFGSEENHYLFWVGFLYFYMYSSNFWSFDQKILY